MTEDIFRVEWDTGYIETLVGSFFVEATVAQINKLFKLARQHCTEAQRDELLRALIRADKERKDLLDDLDKAAYAKAKLAYQFYGTRCAPEQGWAEKRARRERTRLQKAVDLLKVERWG